VRSTFKDIQNVRKYYEKNAEETRRVEDVLLLNNALVMNALENGDFPLSHLKKHTWINNDKPIRSADKFLCGKD